MVKSRAAGEPVVRRPSGGRRINSVLKYVKNMVSKQCVDEVCREVEFGVARGSSNPPVYPVSRPRHSAKPTYSMYSVGRSHMKHIAGPLLGLQHLSSV